MLKEIEKAIQKSYLGVTPQSDGKVLRLTMPPLSGDQRKKYASRVKDLSEEARVSMRNTRRDENKRADALLKDSKMTEDEHKKCIEDIQKCLKEFEDMVTQALERKTAEVMET
jgi:ribosome recycling factor